MMIEMPGQLRGPVATGQTPPPAPTPARGEITSDFETFLRMLTVQMQNQNPLEPIEASDFAVQLATFSSVEQQVRTNDLLTQLTSRTGLSEMSSWIDRKVLSTAPHHVGDGALDLVVPDTSGSDRAELVFRTVSGTEVARFAVAPKGTNLTFTPPQHGAGAIPAGDYMVELEQFQGTASLGAEPALGYSRVTEARMEAGNMKLILEHGHIIDSTDVVGTRG